MPETQKVWPVILSGGSGTRLWPKSRTLFPKQFHVLTSEHSLLQEALLRVKDTVIYADPIVVCNEDHRFIVAEQAEELGIKLQDIVLEPEGRNTAPAVAVATAIVSRLDPNGLVLVLAADHHIPRLDAFTAAVQQGVSAANAKFICTFGITPNAPETGYGYIKRLPEQVAKGVYKIDQFKEKPELAIAKKYIADPSYSWNAGMFLFLAARMQEELIKHEPSIFPACEEAIDNGSKDFIASSSFLRLSGPHFAKAKAISLDFAVMERTKFAAVIPLDASWTDVGSWPSLFATCVDKPMNSIGKTGSQQGKSEGVFVKGEVHSLDVKNCYLSTDGPLLAAIGIEGLAVIATDDAVLVLPMDRSQDVGKIAKALNKNPATCKFAQKHTSEYKPWGTMKTLVVQPGFRALQLTVKAGASTSLQKHYHRAMHYVIVEGTATVTNGGDTFNLYKNESTYIAIGTAHRLSNPGKVPLVVMEVQSGEYLGDDDIVRIDPAVGSRNPGTGGSSDSSLAREHAAPPRASQLPPSQAQPHRCLASPAAPTHPPAHRRGRVCSFSPCRAVRGAVDRQEARHQGRRRATDCRQRTARAASADDAPGRCRRPRRRNCRARHERAQVDVNLCRGVQLREGRAMSDGPVRYM